MFCRATLASLLYESKSQQRRLPGLDIGSFEHARREILIGFMNLELALEADAWVCTLSSNWCRLIDELRMTIGRKASHPYLSLSKGHEGALSSSRTPLLSQFLMPSFREAEVLANASHVHAM